MRKSLLVAALVAASLGTVGPLEAVYAKGDVTYHKPTNVRGLSSGC